MKKIIIAIDGFSSTGKSTLAKELAKKIGYIYVDTGAMYRAVTLFALQNNCIDKGSINKTELISKLPEVKLEFKFNTELNFGEMYLNGTNVEKQIRGMEVSNLVSKISEISEVRSKLVEQQQKMGKNKGIVMDGRDIGTVVFPDAELKLFMTAPPQTRAKRRYEELKEKGIEVSFDEILQNIEERDHTDTHRKDSPLTQSKDAVLFDNSNFSKEEQLEKVIKLLDVKKLIKNSIE